MKPTIEWGVLHKKKRYNFYQQRGNNLERKRVIEQKGYLLRQ